MYNKYKYLKTSDKKVLRKVKKQWITISLALLMAIGGGVALTHVSVHAADKTPMVSVDNPMSSHSGLMSGDNLENNYAKNDEAYDVTPNSFTNVDGFLTARSWYRPKMIHQNGTTWRTSQQSNSTDYHDFRPVLMHWWPSKNVQVDYLNYMHQHGLASQNYTMTNTQNDLDQATYNVQDKIEQQIYQNGNNGMNPTTESLFSNFINSEPQWNFTSEQPGGGNQGGYLGFENSNLTPWANSNYRLYNRNDGSYDRTHNNHDSLEFLLGNDIDTSNPQVLAENINNLYYMLNIGSVRYGDDTLNIDNPSNFDGIREDATGSMDYDWTDIACRLMNDMYHRDHNDVNADNHLTILEDDANWVKDLNAPSNNRSALTQDQNLLNQLETSLFNKSNTGNQPFDPNNVVNDMRNGAYYINRSDDYTEDQAQPNYSRIGYHDNLQFLSKIQSIAGDSQNRFNTPDGKGLAGAAKIYDNDEWNTVKHYGQYYNLPAGYAIMLTNKDTVPEVFYGDLYVGYKPYMSTKSPYYDAITALLKARRKYVAGGQQMRIYDDGHILTSVRFGKDNAFNDNYGGHQILSPTDDAHTSNDPTTGIGIIVNNDATFTPSSPITLNMGEAHGNQTYKPLMISANTPDGFDFDNSERLTTNAQGLLVIPAEDLKGISNPQNSGSLSVWVPVNAPENQDARTLNTNSTPGDMFDNDIYHSNATLDSHVLYESFSTFLPLTNSNYSNALQNSNNISLLKSLGITDFRFPPYYTPVENDYSFTDSVDHNGYAFQDRYDLGITRPNKYGSIDDLLRENSLFHQAGIHTLVDVVDNQLYDLPNKEIVPVSRVDYFVNHDTNDFNHVLYDDYTDSSNSQMQYQYGGKYLDQLKALYPDIFTTPMVSTNQTLPYNEPIRNWSAKYMNGSNIQGHGFDSVLRDSSNKYYNVGNGHVYVPTVFASIEQQQKDNATTQSGQQSSQNQDHSNTNKSADLNNNGSNQNNQNSNNGSTSEPGIIPNVATNTVSNDSVVTQPTNSKVVNVVNTNAQVSKGSSAEQNKGHYINVPNKVISLIGVTKHNHFYVHGHMVKINYKNAEHAKVLVAYLKGYKVRYTIKIGKLVGYVYGHVKNVKPSFMSHKHVTVKLGKNSIIHVSTKNIKILSAVRKGSKVTYHVGFKYQKHMMHGVVYAKVTKQIFVSYSHKNNKSKRYANVNSMYYAVTTKLNKKHTQPNYVKINQNVWIHSSKKFTKKNAVKSLHRGMNVQVKKIVHSGKATRFVLSHGGYITAHKGLVKLL